MTVNLQALAIKSDQFNVAHLTTMITLHTKEVGLGFIYTYIHTHTHTHIYIYIYLPRLRCGVKMKSAQYHYK